ncbi:MAG TPA: TonB-dependent receptor [Polyangiales bacterium]|nr:TonB-dependent receptor [Polyangiales bacterium]
MLVAANARAHDVDDVDDVDAGVPPSAEEEAASVEPNVLTSPGAESQPLVVVSVRGRSRADAVRRSGYAVSVVELDEAKHRSADLGEVLARDTAVTVQRAGGLGSRGAFALGGLGGERLRFFLDGVPLELMGYVAGVQNVPVNLVERVEVYQGVVPTRLGADALGGAVQLVGAENIRKSAASASYQTGDFGTHRASASGRYVHAPTGLMVHGAAFFDAAANDYLVDVSTYDAQGSTRDVRLPRFHDGYRAHGFDAAIGVVDKPWAERLVLTGFRSSFDNEVQNGATMARPFGEVSFVRDSFGLNAKYAVANVSASARFEATAGYARLDSEFRDISSCVYDWYGRCTPRMPATLKGEITGVPLSTDQRTDTFYLRAEHTQRLSDQVRMRFALAPTYADRSGRNALRGRGYDPLEQPRRLFTAVAGVELETMLLDGRLKNIAFAKGYALATRSHALISTGDWSDMSRTLFRAGAGDSLRLVLTEALYTKASYEYALRQPSTDELFGDGMLVNENLGLRPERSHNANLGVQLDDLESVAGTWRASLSGFARWSDDMIALLAENDYLRNVNIWEARALGVEAALGWTPPQLRWLALEGRVTYQDLRNRSASEERSAGKPGDRIPSIPYLFASGSARLSRERVLVASDSVELTWNVRYVHAFHRGWESQATTADKLTIPAQLSHSAALSYKLAGKFSTTLEAHNLTNEKLFDFYGVQRPGRAFFAKWTVEY